MSNSELLRLIPRVDSIIEAIPKDIYEQMDMKHVKFFVDEELSNIRSRVLKGIQTDLDPSLVVERIVFRIRAALRPNLKRVINATGIVLHTNLGRAVISKHAMKHLYDTMTHYNTLEYDLELGKRGSRYAHIETLLCKLTGAEAALVVNNNAAAVILILNTLASENEVILSRGELVEIGGSFRIPDVMKASGCKLIEVGTTNKTHLHDYESAISEQTKMILKVHTSNYQILGFTKSVSRIELATLCKSRGIPFYEDLGSGAMFDFSPYGRNKETLVSECIEEGVDLLSFSGDKLLGASQAGIIVGKKAYIDRLKKNQLLRALRIDKLTLAVLEDTLLTYLSDDKLKMNNPTVHMLSLSADQVLEKVKDFVKDYQTELQDVGLKVSIESMTSQVGGGAMPLENLASYGICLRGNVNLNRVQFALRQLDIPVILKVEDEAMYLDFRTIFVDDYAPLIRGLVEVLSGGEDE